MRAEVLLSWYTEAGGWTPKLQAASPLLPPLCQVQASPGRNCWQGGAWLHSSTGYSGSGSGRALWGNPIPQTALCLSFLLKSSGRQPLTHGLWPLSKVTEVYTCDLLSCIWGQQKNSAPEFGIQPSFLPLYIARISFPPVSNNIFLMSVWDLIRMALTVIFLPTFCSQPQRYSFLDEALPTALLLMNLQRNPL